MPDFQIKITTPAELAGAQASLAALQGQIDATEKLGKSVDDLVVKEQKLRQAIVEAQLNDITGKGGQAAKEMEETGQAAKKASEGIGEFVGGHKGIHAIGHALNLALPGMQQFTRFLTTGFTAAIGGALLAYEYLNSKIEQFSKLVDDLAGSDNASGGWAEKLAANMRESHVAAEVLERDIQRILDAQQTVAQATDQLISRQKQQTEAANIVADAQTELAKAQVELDEKLGDITPEQAIKIKLDIDEEDFRRKQEVKLAGIKAELEARQKEQSSLGGRGGAMDQDQQAVKAAQAQADAAKAAKTKNDTLLENARKNLTAAEEDEKKAGERLAQTEYGKLDPRYVADQMERKVAERREEQAQLAIIQHRKEIEQYEGKETGLDTAAENTKKDLEEATSKWKEDAKAAHELTTTINNLTASLAGAQAESAALIALHNQTAQTRADTQNAPTEIARRNVLLHRAMEPDHGASEVSNENTLFNNLSREAGDAINHANMAAQHPGMNFGQLNAAGLVAMVQQLTAFLKNHPALQPTAHDDMQYEIDALKQDLANLTSQGHTSR